MPEIAYRHPLKAPQGITITPKSKKRYDSGFSPSLTIDEAVTYLQEEANRFPADVKITVYTNYERITVPRLRQRVSDDSSACCEIVLDKKSYYLVCHQWGLTEQNLYALHLTLRALHNIVKWGVADYEDIMKGFSATATASLDYNPVNEEELVSRGQWLAILRLDEHATLEEANTAYRHFAKKAAGSEEGLLRLNQAIEAARDYFSKRNGH